MPTNVVSLSSILLAPRHSWRHTAWWWETKGLETLQYSWMAMMAKSKTLPENSWTAWMCQFSAGNKPATLPGLKTPLPMCSQTPLQRGCPQVQPRLCMWLTKGPGLRKIWNFSKVFQRFCVLWNSSSLRNSQKSGVFPKAAGYFSTFPQSFWQSETRCQVQESPQCVKGLVQHPSRAHPCPICPHQWGPRLRRLREALQDLGRSWGFFSGGLPGDEPTMMRIQSTPRMGIQQTRL